MTTATAEAITNWVGTISRVAPLLLIPLSLALCIWFGAGKLPRTLLWLTGTTLGYGVLQLGVLIALGQYYQSVNQIPYREAIYIVENLNMINTTVVTIVYAMQLVTLGLGFYSVCTRRRRDQWWMLAILIGLVAIPFALYFPANQQHVNPGQTSSATWEQLLIMALLSDAAVGLVLGYALHMLRAERGSAQQTEHQRSIAGATDPDAQKA